MKRYLLIFVVFGLFNPFSVDATSKRNNSKKGAQRASQPDKNSLFQRKANNIVMPFKQKISNAKANTAAIQLETEAYEELAHQVACVALDAEGELSKVDDHKKYAKILLDKLKEILRPEGITQGITPYASKARFYRDKFMGSLFLLRDYTSPDVRDVFEAFKIFLQAQDFEKELTDHIKDDQLEKLFNITKSKMNRFSGGVNYELAMRSLRDQDKESFLLDAFNCDHLEALNQLLEMDLPQKVVEEYDQKARCEGDLRAFQLVANYYLKQCKQDIDKDKYSIKFQRLCLESITKWQETKQNLLKNLEPMLPLLREMVKVNKECEQCLITSLSMIGVSKIDNENYVEAQKYFEELLSINPGHQCANVLANMYFNYQLKSLQKKDAFRKGIVILEKAAKNGRNGDIAVRLARMNHYGVQFPIGQLHPNPKKTQEWQQLAKELGVDWKPLDEEICTDFLNGLTNLEKDNYVNAFWFFGKSISNGLFKTNEGCDYFAFMARTSNLEKKLITAEKSNDASIAIQAFSLHALCCVQQLSLQKNETEKVHLFINMINYIIPARNLAKKAKLIGNRRPILFSYADMIVRITLEEYKMKKFPRYSSENQEKLNLHYANYLQSGSDNSAASAAAQYKEDDDIRVERICSTIHGLLSEYPDSTNADRQAEIIGDVSQLLGLIVKLGVAEQTAESVIQVMQRFKEICPEVYAIYPSAVSGNGKDGKAEEA